MNDRDYIVLIDDNGQPYIAHSFLGNARKAVGSAARSAGSAVRSAGNSAYKYIAKIGDRYFYTQDELNAFYGRGKAAASRAASSAKTAVGEALGYGAKRRMETARSERARAEDAMNGAHARAHAAYLRSAQRGDAADQASERRSDEWRDFTRRWLDAGTNYRRAKAAYENSPAAKIDRARSGLAGAVESVRGAASRTAESVRTAASSIASHARDTLDDVMDFLSPDPSTPRLSDPNPRVETETIIPETIIPETIIPETRSAPSSSARRAEAASRLSGASPEYVTEMASNSGIDTSRFLNARRRLNEARRIAMITANADPVAYAAAKRGVERAETQYDTELQGLIAKLLE